ncbi:MAG TPA: SagB/ThcOx family dehydrogenase [Candidatus Obscuribacterales bacterium]
MTDSAQTAAKAVLKKLSQTVFYLYHHATKHTVESLFSGGHYLDWSNQPQPFRRYEGAMACSLSRSLWTSPYSLFQVIELMYGASRAKGEYGATVQAPDEKFLSAFAFYSLSISAWKEIKGSGERWALRVNASSGNLHPTEMHLLVHDLEGMEPGIYHYGARNHNLERRARGQQAQVVWRLVSGSQQCPPLVVCLNSIHWREVWKYRSRGYRYCQHDMGHALGAVTMAAASLGWTSCAYALFPDEAIELTLHLAGTDEVPALVIGLWPLSEEYSLLRCAASPYLVREADRYVDFAGFKQELAACEVDLTIGRPNKLSGHILQYPDVDQTYAASRLTFHEWAEVCSAARKHRDENTRKIAAESGLKIPYDSSHALAHDVDGKVHKTIRRRRSAVDMHYDRKMPLEDLAVILAAATRGFEADFQTSLPMVPGSGKDFQFVDLYVYAHRVTDLAPGVYYYNRYRQELEPRVLEDVRELAKAVSCFQDIAADSCFTLSMVADFGETLALFGERGYRIAHYEAGFIGQMLYLASTALGYDATGIGCFVDDAINAFLEFPPGKEVIYNFTVGEALLDPRLTTLPSYEFADPALNLDTFPRS